MADSRKRAKSPTPGGRGQQSALGRARCLYCAQKLFNCSCALGAPCARWRGTEQAEELRQLDLLGPDEVVMDAAGSGSKGLEM